MITTDFIVYETATGRILRSGICGHLDVVNQAQGGGETAIEGRASDVTEYFDIVEGVIKSRPVIEATMSKTEIVADGVDELVISPLPIPTTVRVQGNEVIVMDGSLEFSTSLAGPLDFRLDAFPYQDKTLIGRAV